MSDKIYAVFAKHLDRDRLLGHCRSDSIEDIRAYYDADKAYGLDIVRVSPVTIPEGYAKSKAELLNQRDLLQKKIDELDIQIKGR